MHGSGREGRSASGSYGASSEATRHDCAGRNSEAVESYGDRFKDESEPSIWPHVGSQSNG
jgi:hypothetical protein